MLWLCQYNTCISAKDYITHKAPAIHQAEQLHSLPTFQQLFYFIFVLQKVVFRSVSPVRIHTEICKYFRNLKYLKFSLGSKETWELFPSFSLSIWVKFCQKFGPVSSPSSLSSYKLCVLCHKYECIVVLPKLNFSCPCQKRTTAVCGDGQDT